MPRAPVYERQIQQQGLPNARFESNAPIEAFGGGAATQGLGAAVGAVSGVVEGIWAEEKKRADGIAVAESDRQTAELEGRIQTGIKNNFQGKKSIEAWEWAEAEWNKGVSSIEDELGNIDQRSAYTKARSDRWTSMNRFIQSHTQSEMEKYDNDVVNSSISQSRELATSNFTDDWKIGQELAKQTGLYTRYAESKGIPPESPQFKEKLAEIQGATHLGVISQRLDAGMYDTAKEYYQAAKGANQLTGKELEKAKALIDTQRIVVEGDRIFQKIMKSPDFLLPGGGVNEAAARQQVEGIKDISAKDKKQVQSYLDTLITDQSIRENKRQKDLDRSFFNSLITYRQQGMGVDKAMQLASKYGGDKYSINQRQDIVRKMYSASKTMDPVRAQELEDRIVAGQSSIQEIDEASKSWLGAEDWNRFRDKQRSVSIKGQDEQERIVYDNLMAEARGKGYNAKRMSEFRAMLREKTAGKSPEQIETIGTEMLEKSPDSSWWSNRANWQIELETKRKTRKDMSEVYNVIGKDETEAIGIYLIENSQPYNTGSIRKFADEFGGMAHIKKGSPVNNAIRSMSTMKDANGAPVKLTPRNIKFFLKRYPTGELR